MASASLLRDAERLWLFTGPGAPEALEFGSPLEAARSTAEQFSSGVPPGLLRRLQGVPGPLRLADAGLLAALRAAGIAVAALPQREAAELAARFPADTQFSDRRQFFLELGRRMVQAQLSRPDELVISLAREEERVERAVGREAGAAEQFLTGGVPAAEQYAAEWARMRELLGEHHLRLIARLDAEAERLLPNMSALLGPRPAARLLAAAGGADRLPRIAASRLQLLGARRRPGPGRNPRFGLLYRSVSASGLPAECWGRYARSLAALAVIAARADLLTHRDLETELLRRRERRRAALAAGSGR